MKNCLLLFTFIVLHVNIVANDTIRIRSEMFGIDVKQKIVIANQDINTINVEWPNKKDAIYLDELYVLEIPVDNVQRGTGYQITNTQGNEYTLYFTQSSLIFITATQEIVNEPKVPAKFTMVESNANKITSDIGIEIRGGVTQFMYSKKSYKIAFREDASGQNNKDVSLLKMRSDDDWDLQAMANEPLRMNEKTSFDIWRIINKLYYQSSETDAVNGSRMKYAELFLNEEYKGIYCVSEPVDRKQLKLKKYDEEKGIRGELYKSRGWGIAVFEECPPYDNNNFSLVGNNGGYDCEYPDEVYPDWKDMYDFVHLVMYGSDSEFYNQYQTYFNRENAVDYFILLNAARASDNTGNNLFVAGYNANEPYFYVPWDFDGTFGNKWDGNKDPKTDDILTNRFYTRLLKDHPENDFNQRLQTKWKLLRDDWLTVSGLMDMFRENYDYLVENGVYEREELIWKDKDNYHFDSQYIDYMQEWIIKRLTFLDNEFNYTTGIQEIGDQGMLCPCNIHVYNVSGQLVKTIHSTNMESEELYNNLNQGIYLIHIQNSDLYKVQKVVVKGKYYLAL
jgi:hypothetical protein